jgi:tetratricopeptide (TPR) repeat protein
MIAHYDEEALIALLDSGVDSDPHLTSCSECRESYDEFRNLTASLADSSTWEPALPSSPPNAKTIANLRAFADAQRDEDEAAVPLVAELLAGSREQWMPRLLADPKYRTAGVVRKLMEASDKAIDVMPPDALEISALSTEIADKLEVEKYPSDTVMKLRGNAWRDRGYVLFYMGRYYEADSSFEVALNAFAQCDISEYDRARLGIASALNARAQEQLDRSLDMSREAQLVFDAFNDRERSVAAGVARAHVLLKSGRAAEALSELRRLLAFSQFISEGLLGRLTSNIAYAYREVGDNVTALDYFKIAGEILDSADETVERLRIEQNVAELLLMNGQLDEAERRLRRLMPQFSELRMLAESTSAALSIAEICTFRRDFEQVRALCETVLDSMQNVGAGAGMRARTALSLLKDAAETRRATTERVRKVRIYIYDALRSQPALFAPSPAE